MVKVAYTVGRFQPPTLGHVRMIRELLRRADGAPTYVFISSTDPIIPSADKEAFLRKMLTNKDGTFPENLKLVDTQKCETPCGGPRGGFMYVKNTTGISGPDVLLLVGDDQYPRFKADSPLWGKDIPIEDRPTVQALERAGPGAATYSSTKARTALAKRDSALFSTFFSDPNSALTENDIKAMGEALLENQAKWPTKKGGAEEDDTAWSELDGGRRYRRKTKRAGRGRKTRRRIKKH